MDAAGGGRRAGGSAAGRLPLAEGRRRRQPGAVDPPLRPSRRQARSARRAAAVGDPSLLAETHGVTEDDLRRAAGEPDRRARSTASRRRYDAIEALRRIYCSTTGYDYAHVFVPEEREWLRQAAERGRFRAPADPINPVALLDRLTQVEAFERFLHRTFPGKTRFSIEGLDMLVPVLDEVIGEAGEAGIRQILIGMAHRGRLNVMAHVLNKPYAQILAEFKDPVVAQLPRGHGVDRRREVPRRRARARSRAARAMDLVVSMPPNPSHLEAVDPVVEGMARAAGTSVDGRGAPKFDPDAQRADPDPRRRGVPRPGRRRRDAEPEPAARLLRPAARSTSSPTTSSGSRPVPRTSYSTSYASGLARGFKIPIVHVNADDPEACVEAARLAFAYREQFQRDFLIDLIGYRRYGHNEGDEPAFTQPLMYQKIARASDGARDLGDDARSSAASSQPDSAEAMLQDAHGPSCRRRSTRCSPSRISSSRSPRRRRRARRRKAHTAVPLERLRELNASLLALPAGFTIHKKLERGAREARRSARRRRRADGRLGGGRRAGARVDPRATASASG